MRRTRPTTIEAYLPAEISDEELDGLVAEASRGDRGLVAA